MSPRYFCGLLLSLVLPVIGCTGGGDGPPLGSVSGKVTFEGAPAQNVTVSFNPVEGGRGSTGTTDSDGNYTLVYSSTSKGAELGKHNVTVGGPAHPSSDDVDVRKPQSTVPAEIAQMSKEVEVEKGNNTIDLAYP